MTYISQAIKKIINISTFGTISDDWFKPLCLSHQISDTFSCCQGHPS